MYADGNTYNFGDIVWYLCKSKEMIVIIRSLYDNNKTNPEYGGLILPGIDINLAGENLYFDIIAKAVIGLPETSFIFSGVDGQVALYFDIFSDLQLGFDLSAFIDMTNGFMEPETNYTGKVNLKYLF